MTSVLMSNDELHFFETSLTLSFSVVCSLFPVFFLQSWTVCAKGNQWGILEQLGYVCAWLLRMWSSALIIFRSSWAPHMTNKEVHLRFPVFVGFVLALRFKTRFFLFPFSKLFRFFLCGAYVSIISLEVFLRVVFLFLCFLHVWLDVVTVLLFLYLWLVRQKGLFSDVFPVVSHPFSCVFLFLSWTFPFQQVRRAKNGDAAFFLGLLWEKFVAFSSIFCFFFHFFFSCLCSLGLSQSRSDRRGCQSCLAGFSSSLQDMKTLRYKKCECEAALSCVCGSQKTFLMFLCFASGIFTGCTCFALDGRRSVKNNSHIFEPPRVRSRGPVACLRTSIVGDERQEGVWQMAKKMKRFL